ncbi:hypothetical protein ACMYSQ_009703 [Aspergillus niger]
MAYRTVCGAHSPIRMSLRMEGTIRCKSLHNGCADSALRMSNYKVDTMYPDDMLGHSCASKLRIPGRMGFGNGHDRCGRNRPLCIYTASIAADRYVRKALGYHTDESNSLHHHSQSSVSGRCGRSDPWCGKRA